MFKKSVLSFCCLLLLAMVMCKKDLPTRPKIDNNNDSLTEPIIIDPNDSLTGPKTVDKADMLGTWYLVYSEESWNYMENGVPDIGSDSQTETGIDKVFIAGESQITFYTNNTSCYDVESELYTLSGNKLLGDYFDGTYTDSDGTEIWETTVSLNGDQLIVTYTETDNFSDYTGWYKNTMTMKKHSGAFPPANWPQTLCGGVSKKIRGRLKRR